MTTIDMNEYERMEAEKDRLVSWLEDQEELKNINDGFTISFKIGDFSEYSIGEDNYLSRSEVHTGFIVSGYPCIFNEVLFHLPPVSRDNDVESVLDELPHAFSWFDGTRRMSFSLHQLDDHYLPHIAVIDSVDRVDTDDVIEALEVAIEYYNRFCGEERERPEIEVQESILG